MQRMFLTRFGQRTTSHNISTSVTVNIEREPERTGRNTRVGTGEFRFLGTRQPSCVRQARSVPAEQTGTAGKWMGCRCGWLMDETWTSRWADGTTQRGIKARINSVGGKRAGPSPGQIHYGVHCFFFLLSFLTPSCKNRESSQFCLKIF